MTLTERRLDGSAPVGGDGAARAVIGGVATAVPPDSYSQDDILDLYDVSDEKIAGIFRSGHIDRRHLALPVDDQGRPLDETQGQLVAKHRSVGVDIGATALSRALLETGLRPEQVDAICCVTSTGLLTPGFSALLIDRLGLRADCARFDLVGMGCNAGMNGLRLASSWAVANPGKIVALVCIEVCSAAYVFDGTIRTSVVNSLFGDGAAAALLGTGLVGSNGPQILGFESHIITDALMAMRYDWDDRAGKNSFYLDPAIPYVVGRNVGIPVSRLLDRFALKPTRIAEWIVHSGGKKVIDSVKVNLHLTRHQMRHTSSVLRDHGNLSSCSILFSYRGLMDEGGLEAGDRALIIAMGPGSQIEVGLLGRSGS